MGVGEAAYCQRFSDESGRNTCCVIDGTWMAGWTSGKWARDLQVGTIACAELEAYVPAGAMPIRSMVR